MILKNKASSLFWPVVVTPKKAVQRNVEAISRSQKLMVEMGLVKPANNGTFHIMPLAQRSLEKCINLLDHRMAAIGGQKISLPLLTSSLLWRNSGRLDGDITEFYMLKDRHGKDFLLSPTHEESVTAMLASTAPISYRQLPLYLYQIGPKFRDELKSRFGLIRAKEFLMKDMYTFDRNGPEACKTYEIVSLTYEKFFRQLEVPFLKVEADGGLMGGNISHEFHYVSETGEDRIFRCSSCGRAFNAEFLQGLDSCGECKQNRLEEVRGIEVGHTFLLGDKYSRPLGATFLQENGKPENLIMGCYGIGISRLVAATLEILSTESNLVWPTLLAPFEVCVIGPKQGSKEQQVGDPIERTFEHCLANICGAENIFYDDRKHLTIGKRLMDAKRMGFPLIVVIGAKVTLEIPKIELHVRGEIMDLEFNEVLYEITKFKNMKQDLLNM